MVRPPPLVLRERVSLGGKTNLPPPSQLPSEPVKYWGAVYSLTGEKIASTFAPPTQEGCDHPAVVYGLLNPGEVEREAKGGVVVKPPPPKRPLQPKRIFVGVVQRHWGYSKHRSIKELVDKSSYVLPKRLAALKKRKKQKQYDRETRWYVGHRARLFWPKKEEEYCSLLDDLSPLSSLEDEDEDEEKEGEEQVDGCEVLQVQGGLFRLVFLLLLLIFVLNEFSFLQRNLERRLLERTLWVK